ncbi:MULTISPECIES: DUF4345 family protein [Mycobacteriaceae]|uniref:Membrane protein n=1 Tax=Mycolicibacterium neoaurum VKM Ac-1815D TaxID=700508 RepID=V5XAC4_MYCNE|nr:MULTISPECIES: DUF4345 family protein [Mycobacteriaceae]AXK76354.1 DUF4345 domain-containing protein [Mycolicibacterium neoaurum]
MTAVVIVSVGVFMAGMGLYALAAPAALLRPFGFAVNTDVQRAEVRAVYGGFGIAIAGVLGYALSAPDVVRAGILLTVGVALAGMAVGRIISAAVGDRTAFYPNWFYCLVEGVAAAVLFWVA